MEDTDSLLMTILEQYIDDYVTLATKHIYTV